MRNVSGYNNTAVGAFALQSNVTGYYNTGNGWNGLHGNTVGSQNTAGGSLALYSNATGSYNSAKGTKALYNNTSGSYNTALGFYAGYNLTTGVSNIDIGNQGMAGESAVIRIGTQGTQVGAFIAGINGSAISGSEVVINGSGRLGVVVSSARYKRDITDMGNSTDGLMKLHPVTFEYKSDPQRVKQYGLVAEEVDKVYPELVVHNDDGTVESVRYSMLTSMLLNVVQKQQAELVEQKASMQRQIAEFKASNEQERAKRVAIEDRLAKLEQTIVAQHEGHKIDAAFNR